VDYRITIAGVIVGFLIGLTGMGGGSLLAPILILIFRVPPVWAVASDITYSTVTKAVGSIIHFRQKQINFRVALWLACGSVPATLISVFLVRFIRKHYGELINGIIIHAIGGVLIFVAILIFIRPYLLRWIEQRRTKQLEHAQQSEANLQTLENTQQQPEGEGALATTSVQNKPTRAWSRPLATAIVGAIVGFLVGLTSVGSGTLIIVSIAFLYPKLTPKELVGTDVFQAFLLLLAGVVGYLGSGSINWMIVGALLIGSLPGVIIGSITSKFIPNRFLNPVLAVVLAISGWKLI
jgi:hypothetical protein